MHFEQENDNCDISSFHKLGFLDTIISDALLFALSVKDWPFAYQNAILHLGTIYKQS